MNSKRRYEFSWDLIGDIENGRPNLGNTTRVEVYRLIQFAFRDIIKQLQFVLKDLGIGILRIEQADMDKEVDCWCTGDRTCRFNAKAIQFINKEEL